VRVSPQLPSDCRAENIWENGAMLQLDNPLKRGITVQE